MSAEVHKSTNKQQENAHKNSQSVTLRAAQIAYWNIAICTLNATESLSAIFLLCDLTGFRSPTFTFSQTHTRLSINTIKILGIFLIAPGI